jgi:hypothetical protein
MAQLPVWFDDALQGLRSGDVDAFVTHDGGQVSHFRHSMVPLPPAAS